MDGSIPRAVVQAVLRFLESEAPMGEEAWLGQALVLLAEAARVERGALYEVWPSPRGGLSARRAHVWAASAAPAHALPAQVDLPPAVPWAELGSGSALIEAAGARGALVSEDAGAYCLVPWIEGERLRRILVLEDTAGDRPFGPELRADLAEAVGHLGRALARGRTLKQAERRLSLAIEASGGAYFEMARDLSWIRLDESTARILGHPLESIPQCGEGIITWWRAHLYPSDEPRLRAVLKALGQGETSLRVECRLRRADQHWQWLQLVAQVVEWNGDGAPARLAGIVRDVTRMKEETHRIEHIAHHDALTDLPNRALFRDRLQQARERLDRDGTYFSVLFLDLDHFKAVNDHHGHPVGDELLREVAHRLKDVVRRTDTVARFGGDEFAVLQSDVHAPSSTARLADKIIMRLQEPFEVAGHQVRSGTSIGAVVVTSPQDTPDELLAKADFALYEAKASRGTYRLHSPRMDAEVRRQAELTSDLQVALDDGELDLAFLPQVDIATGRPVAVEVLARWQHPRLGDIPPAEFIARAEDSGLMVRLGETILRRSLAATRDLEGRDGPLPVAINISRIQVLDRRFEELLAGALKEADFPASRLILELTEDALATDDSGVLERLRRISAAGIRLTVDDFGMGACRLSALSCLPLYRLKLAQELVARLCEDEDAAKMVRTLLAVAASLGVPAVAEGVRDEAVFAAVHALGVREVQGFFVCSPLTADGLQPYLQG
ncbi:MAG: EAL domain-containing protein [Myxococcales bacterium]|nr:EAL domain-containing protein [Myxococcales bacterium]